MTERFSASSAERLMACPGSGNLDLAIPGWIPPEKNEEGMKGQGHIFHELVEGLVNLMTPKEMEQFAACLAEVAALRRKRRFKKLTEHTFECDWLPSKPNTTVDLVLYLKDELHIIDWKWGAIEVEVLDNPQLLFYARSAIHLSPEAKEVHLHIAQPKAGGLSSAVVSAGQLATWAAEAVEADKKITAKDTTLVPTDKGCLFCPAHPHSRGDKGSPLCPVQMDILYPRVAFDEDEILGG